MGFLKFLKGAADQLDFIPGFDPVKDKRGAISSMFGGGLGQTPPIVQPGTIPGGAGVDPYSNPYAEFVEPRGFLENFLTPGSEKRFRAKGRDNYLQEMGNIAARRRTDDALTRAGFGDFAGMDNGTRSFIAARQDQQQAQNNWQAGHDRGILESDRIFEAGRTDAQQRQDNWQATFDFNQNRAAIGDDQWQAGHDLQTRLADSTIAKNKADAEAAANPVADLTDIKGLRDTYDKRANDFETAQRNFNTMQQLAQDDTGASDVALGFAFFKTIDPNSSVREGEFAAAASGQGLDARLQTMFANLDKGVKFSADLRRELLQAAGHAYEQQVTDITGLYERNLNLAQTYNIDPDLIAYDPVRRASTQPESNSPGLVIGQEVDGFKYLGGDPKDPLNWAPVQQPGPAATPPTLGNGGL